jgi:SWI/SNF-related matrix-associated actin-dependent regulator of chromatin subfamily A3
LIYEPRNIKIYGATDKRAILEPKLIWATPGQRGFAPLNVAAAPSAALPHGSAPLYSQGGYAYNFSQTGPSGSQRAAAPKFTTSREEAQRKLEEDFVNAHELRHILENLEKIDNGQRRTSLLDTLCSVEDALALPEYPSPPGKDGDLTVDLLKHQASSVA